MNDKGNLTDERPPLLPVIIGTGFGSGFFDMVKPLGIPYMLTAGLAIHIYI